MEKPELSKNSCVFDIKLSSSGANFSNVHLDITIHRTLLIQVIGSSNLLDRDNRW